MVDIIIENILSNAIKYSEPNGSVEVNVVRVKGSVQLAVIDHGVGIDKGQLPRIFDRFYRVDESRNAEISGAGLGLAIVKRLVELQGLSIQAESEPGSGTTIALTFPVPARSET
jgi:signal transduction histidine kinase